jgi:hypothetical protein
MRDRFVRWVVAGGCAGLVVGAIIGTIQWPFVGTLFFGVPAMAVGAATGAVLGVVFKSVRLPAVPWLPVLIGTSFGAWVGAVAGLALGLHVYPPTAGFAAVEGAVFGVIPGFVLGLGAALVAAIRIR